MSSNIQINAERHVAEVREMTGSEMVRHLDSSHGVTCRPDMGLSVADVVRIHESLHASDLATDNAS